MNLRSLLAITVTIVLLMSCLSGMEQNSPSMRDVLSQIKRIPARYTKGYVHDGKGEQFTNVDSTYRVIVQMDTFAIIQLLPVLSDTAATAIPNTCDGGYLTYGQLAFILINDIESVPFALVTKWQWCTMDDCGWLPDGFLAYVRKRPAEFERQYRAYFNSKDRQNILRESRREKKEQRRKL